MDKIIDGGFDERLGSLSGLFGSGIYFAENSAKRFVTEQDRNKKTNKQQKVVTFHSSYIFVQYWIHAYSHVQTSGGELREVCMHLQRLEGQTIRFHLASSAGHSLDPFGLH